MSDTILERLRAALGERYTIDRQVGQGGMATVYGATDRKHNRQVAIKVLRPELAATIGGDRFLREIEVSARLQHPHIVPLYDSGDAGGVLYYVMPFITGESLRDRLTRDGKIPFEEAVALLRQMASALAYAHQQGIIHRDIKPENVLLSNGVAVVADFGIARALRAASDGSMTGLGFAIGTPAYMSPEQATASDIDERSDQYSLACVFYEMVTGAAPFAAPTMQAVLTKSLSGPRPKLSKVARTTPAEADAPVTRALAADPKDRYTTVTDFAAALERAAGGGSGAVAERTRLRRLVVGLPLAVAAIALAVFAFLPRGGSVVRGAESMVVLPFNATGPGVDVLGEGMVDLLTTNLNAVGGIRAVEPRAVLARLKKEGPPADVEDALRFAGALKANSVVMGSIVAAGNRVRVSADLYGPEGTRLAGAQVDGAADSVLQLVDQLSLSLVRDIWRSKEPVPSLRVTGLTTTSLAAMREYLVGEQYYRKATWDSAAAAFQRAIAQDSTFALAHYRLAATVGWSGGLGLAAGLTAIDAALRFADRLPPRERSLVVAYNLFEHQKLAATDSARAYVRLYPDDVDGWFLLGETMYHTRQLVGYTVDEMRAPFDSVLARDSTLTPAAIHPSELALGTRDQRRYDAYLRVLGHSDNPVELQAYTGAGRMVFGDGAVDSATAKAMLRYGSSVGAVQTSTLYGISSSDSALARFDGLRPFIELSGLGLGQYVGGRGILLASMGRLQEASALFDSAKAGGLSQDQAFGILIFPHMYGYAPAGFGEAVLAAMAKAPRTNPFRGFYDALLLANRGERAAANGLLDSLLSHPDPKMPPKAYDMLRAAKGSMAVTAGDTAGGIATMQAALEDVGAGWNSFMTSPLRLQMATAMALRPATRQAGLRMLEEAFATDLGLAPLAAYALGRAQEAAGNRAAAADAYTTFLKWWDKADPAMQPRVDEVKAALARVAGEPK